MLICVFQEHGLRFVNDDTLDLTNESDSASKRENGLPSAALLTSEAVEILDAYSGTLDERLRKLAEDKRNLEKEVH